MRIHPVTDLARSLELSSSPATTICEILWLHIGNQRLAREDAPDLTQRAAKLDLSQWPGPVLKLYLGQMTAAQLLAAAASPNAETQKVHLCDANFYVGEDALFKKQRALALARFQAARDTCLKSFLEYDGAVAELKRLSAKKAPAK